MSPDGYDEHGNPEPEPGDKCDCGRRRDEAEELFIETLGPFGDSTYICKRCKDAGRGMK